MTKSSKLSGLFKALERVGLDSFLLLLLLMIVLAYFFPSLGAAQGTFSLKNLANVGVSFIFFFYGLRLSPQKLKAGLSNWRLHVVIQLTTFVLFPLLVLAVKPLFKGADNQLLWLGTFYLAALPSTVSSSVVMVSIARGNIPAAIFNASISSLLGVFITPLLMGLVMSGEQNSLELGGVIVQLIVQVLLPVCAGIFLNRYWGQFAERHKKTLRKFDQSIILLIIYTSFCQSFKQDAFSGFGALKLILCGLGMIALFFVVYGIVDLVSHWLKFNREDRITALFCGSKKSLVHGTVMSKVLFPTNPQVGVLLLPIMMYHALQLVIVSIIARRMAKQSGTVADDE